MNVWCHVASILSLAVSAVNALHLYPGPGKGFHGAVSLSLTFLFIGQGLFLLFLVGIPLGVVYLGGRRPASRLGLGLLCLAAIAVVVEFFRINAIPISGRC
jgi:hypothetical protein